MSMKFCAMIPCRLGSQRVPNKNLRLLGGKTLSQWVGTACKEANIFNEIYINSEAEIFKGIAEDIGIKFHHRPPNLATNSATNDDFALEFMNNHEFDVLVQVNPTSPFITAEDIKSFISFYLDGGFETLHTVKEERIEGLFKGSPLNFDNMKPMPPSQELIPVQLFSSSIMAWDVKKFKSNMKRFGCAVYGGDGKIGYYSLSGFANLDIDYEIDFQLANAIYKLELNEDEERKYYEV